MTDPAGNPVYSTQPFPAGVKLRGDHLSGSIGFGHAWGSSKPFEFGATVPGTPPITTKLTITSLSLLYAVAYKFWVPAAHVPGAQIREFP